MSRNIISGRYGSVQRLLPTGKFDANGHAYWYGFDDGYGGSGIRGPKPTSSNDDYQGSQPSDAAKAASLIDKGSIIDEGKYDVGYASTISAVTSWTLENQATAIQYTASNTRGYKGKLEGTHNASGNISGIGAVPPIAPGQRFRFYGYVGPDNGKLDNYNGTVYRITAIANSVQIQINYQLQNPCTWSVGWMSDWKDPGDELWANRLNSDSEECLDECMGFWDYTKMDCSTLLPSSKDCLWMEGVDRPICLLDANIQFNTETSPFTNSCSSSVGGWQSVVVGPTDCTVSANIHGDNYGDFYSKDSVANYYDVRSYDNDLATSQQMRKFWAGSNHAMRIHVGNNGAYWEFYKLMITGFGGLNVDTTSNNPLQFSCNMEFNAFPQGKDGCDPGYIIYNSGKVVDDSGDLQPEAYKNFALVDLRTERRKGVAFDTNNPHQSAIGDDVSGYADIIGQKNSVQLDETAIQNDDAIKFEKWVASCAGAAQDIMNGDVCGKGEYQKANTDN